MDVLRDASINISTDEVLSLFNALPHISLMDKQIFKQTLKTTLVKDYTDIPVFDRCFDEFFHGGEDAQVDVANAFREMAARDTLQENSDMTPGGGGSPGAGPQRFHTEPAGRNPVRAIARRHHEPVHGRAGAGGIGGRDGADAF